MKNVLEYVGVFVIGYLALVNFGLDNYQTPQWILIFVVAFHRQLPSWAKYLYCKWKERAY
jgi:hypothetical protein